MPAYPALCHRRVSVLLLTCLTLCGWVVVPRVLAAAPSPAAPSIVQMPTELPSGDAVNDVIWVTFYPAAASVRPAPAIVLLHPIGEDQGDLSDRYMHRLAQRFAERGIGCALMTLPWHSQRRRPHVDNLYHFIGPNIDDVIQSLTQSSSDVSTVTSWLSKRPDVDPHRLGVAGISLGAIVAHLAMGRDTRLRAGVAMEGGGDLPALYHTSAEVLLHSRPAAKALTEADFARLAVVDPAAPGYAQVNRPRHVLMIEAARDLYVPPANATFLWNALGRPPIQWLDTNHFAFVLTGDTLAAAGTAYLNGIWDGKPEGSFAVPRVHTVVLKFGWLYEFSGYTTPDVQWQFLSLGSRPDHLSLLSLNIGESGRGPFASLALTATPYFDIGVAQTVRGHPIQPYLSAHLVF